jgi:hypothetical protein
MAKDQQMNVYVLAGGRRHVKIGIARDVMKRLRGVQTGCPFKLRIVKQWNTGRAAEVEKAAHRILSNYRWTGEWFDVPQRAAVLVVETLVRALPTHIHAPREPVSKTIAFCKHCGHSSSLAKMPTRSAALRCTNCHKTEHVHCVEVAFMPKSLLKFAA